MGRYLFQNGNVYFACGDDPTCMTVDDFMASAHVADKEAHVLLVLSTEDQPAMIRRISRAFPRGGIRTFVPYSLALRAYLWGQNLVPAEQPMIVIDNIGDRYLLTAYNTREAVETRVLLPQNAERIAEEVRRSRKNLIEGLPTAACCLLGNDAAVIEVLSAEDKENVVFFETLFPAFEVLGTVRFAVHLMAPEDAAARQRQADRRGLLGAGAMALLMALAGIGYGWSAVMSEQAVDTAAQEATDQRAGGVPALKEVSIVTYQARLRQWPRVDFFDVSRQFMEGLPLESRVSSVTFERGQSDGWIFTGELVFEQKQVFPFSGHGLFTEAVSEAIVIEDKPGLKIRAVFSTCPDEERRAP